LSYTFTLCLKEALNVLLKKGDVDAAEKDLLLLHAKTAAALLANRSMAFAKMGSFIKSLDDAKLCLRCAPTWPKVLLLYSTQL
jgi:hypothetical protein